MRAALLFMSLLVVAVGCGEDENSRLLDLSCEGAVEHGGASCSGCDNFGACELTCPPGRARLEVGPDADGEGLARGLACLDTDRPQRSDGTCPCDVCLYVPGLGRSYCLDGPHVMFTPQGRRVLQQWTVDGALDGPNIRWAPNDDAVVLACVWSGGQAVESLAGECP